MRCWSAAGVMLIIVLEQMEQTLQKMCEKKFEEAKENGIPILTHWTQHAISFSNILQVRAAFLPLPPRRRRLRVCSLFC